MDALDQTPDLRDRPFTLAQARDVGVDARQLHRAVRAGWLRHPVRGVYVPSSLPDDLRTRCAVLQLSIPEDAFVCDHTAAWLHAGDRALVPGDHRLVPELSCFRPTDSGRLRRDEVRSGERLVEPGDVVSLGGLDVTTPLRTALDIGRLARNDDVRLHGMDTMLSLGEFVLDDLLGEIVRFKGHRGVVGLRALAPLADGGAASFGESALRLRWHRAGLPRPVTQLEVPGPHGSSYFLDIGLGDVMLGCEYDGEDFHSSPDQVAHDRARRLWIRRQGWALEEFRREHVFGRQQAIEAHLRATYAALVAVTRRRRYF